MDFMELCVVVKIRSIGPTFVHHLCIDTIFCRLNFGYSGCLSQIDFICKGAKLKKVVVLFNRFVC